MSDQFQVDRKAFSVISIDTQIEDEKRYWFDKSPLERWEALELTRQILYGYNPTTLRFQRVFEIAERP